MPWRSEPVKLARQQGLALLVLVIAMALVSLAWFFSHTPPQLLQLEREQATRQALQQAKQALIHYAVNYPEITGARGPGYLPCPDRDNDGSADTAAVPSCNSAVGTQGSVGRLPFLSLNAGDLRDGTGERLWYAVSRSYSNFGTKDVNSAKYGSITVRNRDGVIIHDGTGVDAAIAVIIAPGAPLVREDGWVQNRSAGTADLNDPANYLDVALGESNTDFIQSGGDGFISGEVLAADGRVISNDIIEVITYRDLMQPVMQRVSAELSRVLQAYRNACGAYPEALDFDASRPGGDYESDGESIGHVPVDEAEPADWDDGCAAGIELPFWLEEEDWHKEILYAYSETVPCAGGDCLTVENLPAPNDDIELLLVFAGRDLNGTHDDSDIDEYFENENADGDRVFDAAENEDYVYVLSQ